MKQQQMSHTSHKPRINLVTAQSSQVASARGKRKRARNEEDTVNVCCVVHDLLQHVGQRTDYALSEGYCGLWWQLINSSEFCSIRSMEGRLMSDGDDE